MNKKAKASDEIDLIEMLGDKIIELATEHDPNISLSALINVTAKSFAIAIVKALDESKMSEKAAITMHTRQFEDLLGAWVETIKESASIEEKE